MNGNQQIAEPDPNVLSEKIKNLKTQIQGERENKTNEYIPERSSFVCEKMCNLVYLVYISRNCHWKTH